MQKYSKNIQTFLKALEYEVSGKTKDVLPLLHPGYSNTNVNNGFDKLFDRSEVSDEDDLSDTYKIQGRKYEIYNITESENTVMVEMIESYPDPKTGKVYRTPQVIVSEFEDGLIKAGRHYNDPALSFMHLTKDQTDKIFVNPTPIVVIE